ncbi:hypothetical protein E5K00_08035 [Hymenobacter aquaticus]|uniref:Uncharacterized protein n=1 Tax=Hymenobacter aquaticus TaxID=1867101 RepID=A0A4Z0Q6Q7_9BACT|nr:hypothetical protein [Hymenobacter aquaticus]TGE25136.1 hypothetical protein E5K00_08035 [Hymenobacter aquaticus]
MLRKSYSTSRAAAVRRYFALSQLELARFLGVTRGQVAHVEAGRSTFSDTVYCRLRVLEGLMHALPTTPAEPRALPLPADLKPLRQRLLRCRYLAANVRYQLEDHHRYAQTHADRLLALARLRSVLFPASPPPLVDPAADPPRDQKWLTRLEFDTAVAPAPLSAAERALLELRLRHLEEEAALLAALLPPVPPA